MEIQVNVWSTRCCIQSIEFSHVDGNVARYGHNRENNIYWSINTNFPSTFIFQENAWLSYEITIDQDSMYITRWKSFSICLYNVRDGSLSSILLSFKLLLMKWWLFMWHFTPQHEIQDWMHVSDPEFVNVEETASEINSIWSPLWLKKLQQSK